MNKSQPATCLHGKVPKTECIDCALIAEERAFDAAMREVEMRGKRVRALKALRANRS